MKEIKDVDIVFIDGYDASWRNKAIHENYKEKLYLDDAEMIFFNIPIEKIELDDNIGSRRAYGDELRTINLISYYFHKESLMDKEKS